MPNYEARIDPAQVRGNDFDIIRTVSVVPTGAALTDAWLRVNEADTSTELFEKHVTVSLVADQGQIEDDGDGDGVAIIRFRLTSTDTLLCEGGTVADPAEHSYGIQVKSDSGAIYEFEQGLLPMIQQIVESS